VWAVDGMMKTKQSASDQTDEDRTLSISTLLKINGEQKAGGEYGLLRKMRIKFCISPRPTVKMFPLWTVGRFQSSAAKRARDKLACRCDVPMSQRMVPECLRCSRIAAPCARLKVR